MTVLTKALPALALLSGLAAAYDGSGESFTSGDVVSNPPWQLAQTDFQQSLSQPNATGSTQITGYNLSSTDAALDTTRDWTLRVAVRADVPLKSASSSSLAGNDKTKFTHITTLSVDAPDPFIINNADPAYRLCGIVYPGLADDATRKGNQATDGQCGSALNGQCAKDLAAAAQTANADRSKSCSAPVLPASCKDSFPSSQSVQAFGKCWTMAAQEPIAVL
jgi:hypothetical protein